MGIVECRTLSTDSKLVGDAGEHFVCYCLARRGISAALMPAGTKSVDILATIDGSAVVSLQIKASWAQWQPRKWTAGKHQPNHSSAFFYVFCNIWKDLSQEPEVFVVPSKFVFEHATWHTKMPTFTIAPDKEHLFKGNWGLIETALSGSRVHP